MTAIITKSKAFEILGLSSDTLELEIKKTYRRLSLQHHPKKNDDSEESQKEFKRIQEAYKILSAGWPTKKYFGFSEEEIEKFENEEIEELKRIPGVDDYSIGKISESIENVKGFINSVKIESSELVPFALPEEKEILNNWLNHLHLMYGLGYGYYDKEVGGWINDIFFGDSFFRLLKPKKWFWDKAQEELKGSFSESEWDEYLKILQKAKSMEEIKDNFYEGLFNLKRRKEIRQEVKESEDSDLLNDIINVEVSFQFDAPPYQEGEDYWASWMNSSSTDAERKKDIIVGILKKYNNQETLVKEKANRYYEVLEVSEEATQREIKKAYLKLSVEKHPDKNTSNKEAEGMFKVIKKAYEVLSDEVERKKYDLCFLTDEEDFYLNRKKWSKIVSSKELVNEGFRKDLELILQDSLKLSDLTWEDLNWCGEKIWRKDEKYLDFRKRKGGTVELMKIEDFCREVLNDEMLQHEAIKKARDYLEIVDSIHAIIREATKNEKKSKIIKDFEEKELAEEPALTREELDEPGKVNCLKRIEKLEVAMKIKGYEAFRKQNKSLIQETFRRIIEVRAFKVSLLKQIEEKIENGQNLLNSVAEKTKIEKFLVEFDNFFTSLKEKTSYQAEIGVPNGPEIQNKLVTVSEKVIQAVLIQKESGINSLKEKLADFLNKAEDKTNETPISFNNEPISSKEKQKIIEYLDDLTFTSFARTKDSKNPSSVKRIKDSLGLNYSELESAINWEQAENIRAKTIRNICEKIQTAKGGSDHDLVAEIKKVNKGFSGVLIKEIEAKGIVFSKLSEEENNLFLKLKRAELEKINFVKELIARKWKILNLNKQDSQKNAEDEEREKKKQEQARIEAENSRREAERLAREKAEQETRERAEKELLEREQEYDNLLKEIEDSDNPEVISLGINCENLRSGRTQEKLEAAKKNRRDVLEKERLAQEEKEVREREERERKEQEINVRVKDYEKLLNDIKIAADTELENLNSQINAFNCDNFPVDKTKRFLKEALNIRKTELIDKVNYEREQKQQAVFQYDNLLKKINSEKDLNADYSEQIENLDWTHLDGKQTRDKLESVWTANRNKLIAEENKRKEKKRLEEEAKIRRWQENVIKQVQTEYEKQKNESGVLDEIIPGWQAQVRAENEEAKIIKLQEKFIKNIREFRVKEEQDKQLKIQQARNLAVKKVRKSWDANQENDKIDEKDQEQLLGNWENVLFGMKDEVEINVEQTRLIRIITEAKNEELTRQKTSTIASIEAHWNEKVALENKLSNKVNGKTKEKILNVDLISPKTWEKDIQIQIDLNSITAKLTYYRGLIDDAKAEENKKVAWHKAAIEMVDVHWEENQDDDKLIDGKTQERTLPPNWQDSIRDKDTQEKIKERVEDLKSLIDQLIEEETVRQNASGTRNKSKKEKELNEKLKTLLDGERTGNSSHKFDLTGRSGNYKKDVEKWFDELIDFIPKEGHQLLKDTCERIALVDWDKIRSKLEEEKSLINNERDFKERIKKDEIEKYLQEIVKVVNNELVREVAITKVNECWNKNLSRFQISIPNKNDFLGTNSLESSFANLKGEQIEVERKRLTKKIRAERIKQFLNKSLEISGLEEQELTNHGFTTELDQKETSKEITNLRNLVFKEIVEIGINKECVKKNSKVSYSDLTNDPINSIPNKSDEQNKLKALETILKEIKEKHRVIVAKNALQELIDKLIPNGNRSELKNDLEDLQKLIPAVSELDEIQINAYREKETEVNKKELELIHALALLEDDLGKVWNNSNNPFDLTNEEKKQLIAANKDNIRDKKREIRENRQRKWNDAQQRIQDSFRSFNSSMNDIEPEVITNAMKKLKQFRDEGTPEEKKAFVEEVSRLENNTSWENRARSRIDALREAIVEKGKIKISIEEATDSVDLENEGSLHKRIKKLEENNLISNHEIIELNHTRQDWLKPLREYESLIRKINEADTWEKLKEAYQKVSYVPKLSVSRFLNRCPENNLFLKIVRKNVQQVVDAYGSIDFQTLIEQETEKIIQTIENCDNTETIDNKLTTQIEELKYDLELYKELRLPEDKKPESLRSLLSNQREKIIFREEFKGCAGDSNIDVDKIDVYFDHFKNISKRITGQQVFNAYRQKWVNPKQIRINDNGEKQINLGGLESDWNNYDWENESFDKANYCHIFVQSYENSLERKRDLPNNFNKIYSYYTKYPEAQKAWIVYDNFWETFDLGDYNDIEKRGKITWDGNRYETNIDPLTENKNNAYIRLFSNSPRSKVTGANHTQTWELEKILPWMKKRYLPETARIVYENEWEANDNSNFMLTRTKFQVQVIQEINDYWENSLRERKLTERTNKNTVLGDDWKNKLLVNKNAIDNKKRSLISLIDQEIEKQRKLREEQESRTQQSNDENKNRTFEPVFFDEKGQSEKLTAEKLDNYFEEFKTGTIEKKFSILNEIEKNQGEEILEKRKSEEWEIRKELAMNDLEKYKQRVIERKKREMKRWEISEDDIENIENIENMLEVEEKIINEIYQKGNDKVIEEKINELEKLKGDEVVNKEKIEELKAKILEFKNSTNIYQRTSYQKQESKIAQLLKGLEVHSPQISSSQKQDFLRKEMIIPLCLIGAVIVLVFIILGRIRKRKPAKRI